MKKSISGFVTVCAFLCLSQSYGEEVLCPKQTEEALSKIGLRKEDVEILTNNECIRNMFELKVKTKKVVMVKNIELPLGSEIGMLGLAVNYIESADNMPLKINENIFCMKRAQFGWSPNKFCECVTAQAISFNGLKIPSALDVHFDSNFKPVKFENISKEITVGGKKILFGKSFKVVKGKVVESKVEERDDCSWD